MGNLFQELKRRKVFRVAAVYAVVAWLLIEVTSTILPTFDTPAWVNQSVTLLFRCANSVFSMHYLSFPTHR